LDKLPRPAQNSKQFGVGASKEANGTIHSALRISVVSQVSLPRQAAVRTKKSRDVLGLFDLLVAFQRFEINHFVRLLTRQKIEKCNFEKSSSIVNVYLNSYLRVKTVCVRQVHHLLSSHSRRSVRNNSLIQKIASQLRRQKFKQLQGDCQKDSRLGKVNKT